MMSGENSYVRHEPIASRIDRSARCPRKHQRRTYDRQQTYRGNDMVAIEPQPCGKPQPPCDPAGIQLATVMISNRRRQARRKSGVRSRAINVACFAGMQH
jgi:hypothetical protein